MSRRRVFRLMGAVGAATLAVGIAGTAERASAQSAAQYKTTAALNLRSGAGTTYGVIAVMPLGTIVAATGNRANGFFEVGYNGTYGWAHSDYLTPVTGGGDPSIVGNARTTTAVNLRSGPSTGHQVLRVVGEGTWVEVSDTVENGFRYVIHQGLAGWIYDAYLTSADDQGGNYATTTAALNLRAEPSTSAAVLTVMPRGSRVQVLHTQAGDFINVNYNGMQGWAHKDYLAW